MDCHFQTNEQVCGRNVRRKERSCRSRRDGNRSRQNTRDNHILRPKCSYQLTNGSGMIFLPSITSVKDHCRGESRTLRQKCYDIMDHTEKMMGRLFGIPCYFGFAAISKIRIARRWSNEDWLNLLQQGSDKKRFFYCLNSDGLVIFLRVIQLYHVGCSRYLHSIMQSGVVAGGKDAANKGRQTVFFTALGTMNNEPEEEYQDLSKPRKIHCKGKWKIIQVAIYWVSLKKAQDNGLKIWQTRSHAMILYGSVPADCLEKVVRTKTGGEYQMWRGFVLEIFERCLAGLTRWAITASFRHRETGGQCRALRIKWRLYKNAMPVLCSILATWSLVLHMRTLPISIREAKIDDERKVLLVVNTLHHNEGSISRCTTWKVWGTTWSSSGSTVSAKREKEPIRICPAKISETRLLPRIENGNWVDGR